jgi:hypothetical protein
VDLGRIRTKVAVAESFGALVELKDTAKSLARLPWTEFRDTLVADFCDTNVMRFELEAKLKQLKFRDSARMAFVHEVRRLWALRTADLEQTWFVTAVFKVVPEDLTEKVITEARRLERGRDWRTTEMRIILDLLREVILERTSLEAVKGSALDKVRFGQESRSRSAASEAQGQPRPRREAAGPNVSRWIDEHKGRVFYIRSRDQARMAKLKATGAEVQECTRVKDNSPYTLAAFASAEFGKQTLAGIFPQEEFWEFKTKN